MDVNVEQLMNTTRKSTNAFGVGAKRTTKQKSKRVKLPSDSIDGRTKQGKEYKGASAVTRYTLSQAEIEQLLK